MELKKKQFISILVILAVIGQVLTGCSKKDDTSINTTGALTEDIISEHIIDEEKISEEKLTEKYIRENFIIEDEIYEYRIGETIISQAYIIETVVDENTIEDIQQQLPQEIQDYEIDWKKVIGKFAVGTAIIVAVGVVNHVTGGSTFFVFGSPITVAKDALIGGAMEAAIREVIGGVKDGKNISKSAKKYAVEGFADGYMWGAITSVLKVTGKNFKRLKAFKLATGGSVAIKADGSVFNEAGQRVGQAFYDNENVWHLLDETSDVVKLFDSSGKALVSSTGVALTENSLPANSVLRLGTGSKEVICKTDDLGQIIIENNVRLPNMSYQLGGHRYYTDKYGRIIKVVFDKLESRPAGRARLTIFDSMTDIGKGDALHGDQRGHLIADRFNGDNTIANIVPMSANANQKEVAAIEGIWAECLQSGGQVSGSIELCYTGTSFRPDSFQYAYDIGEGIITKIISNL